MKPKRKLTLWILAPFIVYIIFCSILVPSVLEHEAWRKGRALSPSETFGAALFGCMLVLAGLPAFLLYGPLVYQVGILLLIAVWTRYLFKFRTEYIKKRLQPG
jgi:hypothetical protein